MCYYDQYRYECNDWKWGNFRRHCHAEYRMGETCGMKLVLNTLPLEGKCRFCESIEKKQRRLEKAWLDYRRWAPDPTRKASAAKAAEDIRTLEAEIETLKREKLAKYNDVSNRGRRAPPQSRYMAA